MSDRPAQATTMIGLELPDVDIWSERVVVALGQNPGLFTGPGTNTYLVGTGPERILLDTGQGLPAYLPVLEQALARVNCRIQEIVLTHGHVDHIRGVEGICEQYGPLRVSKFPWPEFDRACAVEMTPLADGDVVGCEGATLRALHTPGHAADHLCFMLEEEQSAFSGDNVLGVGTTVIPAEGGDLREYMRSLDKLLEESPRRIYPAHGPCIDDGAAKLREYIAHREQREEEVLAALGDGRHTISEIVSLVYAAYPESLHPAARMSVCSHLLKLRREGRVESRGDDALHAHWQLR
jgi:glyoxylase-like metal-dependent hydrolase (beta-lactamase superfamily II)